MVPVHPVTVSNVDDLGTYTGRFGAALRASGMTVRQLSDALGVSYQAVRKVREGLSKSLTASNNQRAADLLGVRAEWLATGRGPMRDGPRLVSPAPVHSIDEALTPDARGAIDVGKTEAFTLPPHLNWGQLVDLVTLPDTFRMSVPDDALAPDVSRGTALILERHDGGRLEPGDGVLVQAADGRRYLRRYVETAGGGWIAQARNSAYATLDSTRDGLTVLAVVVARWDRKV